MTDQPDRRRSTAITMGEMLTRNVTLVRQLRKEAGTRHDLAQHSGALSQCHEADCLETLNILERHGVPKELLPPEKP